MPNSVLVLDGAEHRRQRRLLLPPFHGEWMRSYDGVMTAITEQEVSRWPRDREFPLRVSMQAITFEVILRAVFGGKEAQARAELGDLLRSLTRGVSFALLPGLRHRLGRLSPWARFLQRRRRVDAALYAEIDTVTKIHGWTSATSCSRCSSPATKRPQPRWPGASTCCCIIPTRLRG